MKDGDVATAPVSLTGGDWMATGAVPSDTGREALWTCAGTGIVWT